MGVSERLEQVLNHLASCREEVKTAQEDAFLTMLLEKGMKIGEIRDAPHTITIRTYILNQYIITEEGLVYLQFKMESGVLVNWSVYDMTEEEFAILFWDTYKLFKIESNGDN